MENDLLTEDIVVKPPPPRPEPKRGVVWTENGAVRPSGVARVCGLSPCPWGSQRGVDAPAGFCRRGTDDSSPGCAGDGDAIFLEDEVLLVETNPPDHGAKVDARLRDAEACGGAEPPWRTPVISIETDQR